MKTRHKSEKKNSVPCNENLLNLISPPGLEFEKTSLVNGDNYGKIVNVIRYPSNPDYGWLADITAIEGVTAKAEFFPTDTQPLIDRCNEQIRDYRGDLMTVKDESVRQLKEKTIKDISNMIRRIQEGEVAGYLNILLMIQATSREQLDERMKKVQSVIAAFGGGIRTAIFLQREAYEAIAPYGIPCQSVSDIGSRIMPLSTFIGGFINSSTGINDEIGMLIGKTDKGKMIVLDPSRRGGDRTNMNWFISGVPGVGKSTIIKLINYYLFAAFGAKCMFCDPEGEYSDFVRSLGGNVIDCGGGENGKINPLQVRKAPVRQSGDGEDQDDEDLYKNQGHGMSDLALHIQTLRVFHKLYQPALTAVENAKLEKILEGTYKRFGITWDTDITHIRPEEFPIYSDLYDDIVRAKEAFPDDKDIANLESYFWMLAKGADSFVFNGYTNIDLSADAISLNINKLLEGSENVLKAQMHNCNSFAWHVANEDPDQLFIYNVDEGYLIVDPRFLEPLIFLKNFANRIRKRGGGLIFATHTVADVLSEEVKRYGQALIDNSCYKMIMGTDGKNLKETADLFDLTKAEISLLASKQRGRGLLFAGSSRVSCRVEVPQKILEMMGTAGGK